MKRSRGLGGASVRERHAKVWLLTLALGGVAALLTTLPASEQLTDAPVHISWWVLALGFAAAEVFVIHYQFRRERYTFSLMELPLALGLFFSTWPAVLFARLLGSGLALLLHRRQGPMKLAFNLASFALETALVMCAFRLLAGEAEGQSVRAFASAMGSVTFGVLLATATIVLVISINEGLPDRKTLTRLFTANFVVAVMNVSLALVAVSVLWVSQSAGWLLLVVACILFLGYRSYARLQQKHDDLELLYDFTRRTGTALQIDSAMKELLTQVRGVLRAGVAEIVIRSSRPGSGLVRTVLSGDDDIEVTTAEEDALWRRIDLDGKPLLASAPIREDALRFELAARGIDDAMIAPLRRGDGALIGLMLAGNRLGERTFSLEDLKLFETLANHASVSLENRHLIDRLRMEAADKEHQSLHDALTGLPNRLLFHERVEQALTHSARVSGKVGVMLLDLDRFKEVNDTLGHHNGDLLLQEIAERLRRTIRAGDTVARLGGDEFAVLLPELSGPEAAVAAANGIRHALERPFSIGEVTLDVGASIGIAVWPDHGDDAATLLQRADVAMYAAKATQDAVDVYDPNRDTYSLERLALVGELRRAIEQGELAVHYQPKADTRSGRVIGMEALVRWHHARRGDVPPEEIIRVAEQTGLIRPLTLFVLAQALRQCRSWRRAGFAYDVAVNLSLRNILDAELPNDVLRLLDDVGLPSSALTFEITESSIMADPVRTEAVVSRLRSMGVAMAIDDFGTGYSSFSHLRRLPVDEIKIDKSFVQHMARDDSDFTIVRTIVDLGRNLGIRVVAEGVESIETWEKLASVGCDVIQGFVLSQPLGALDLDRWLAGGGAGVHGPASHKEPSEADVLPLRPPASNR
ncbi:MAG TPA: EAL domain-containing protein [Acidimicrobiales bacterium]|nr:EAL domain-containing protein [Acidimicrobiales bacterium]